MKGRDHRQPDPTGDDDEAQAIGASQQRPKRPLASRTPPTQEATDLNQQATSSSDRRGNPTKRKKTLPRLKPKQQSDATTTKPAESAAKDSATHNVATPHDPATSSDLSAPPTGRRRREPGNPASTDPDRFVRLPFYIRQGVTQHVLKAVDLQVWSALAARVNFKTESDTGRAVCFPSHNTIANDSGISASTVKRSLDRLAAFGAIERSERTVGGSLEYEVFFKSPGTRAIIQASHLTPSGNQRGQASATAEQVIRNRYDGRCQRCGCNLLAGQGRLVGNKPQCLKGTCLLDVVTASESDEHDPFVPPRIRKVR